MPNQQVSWRVWQFHEMDEPYVQGVLKKANDYNINTVVYSHEMIGEISRMYKYTHKGGKPTGFSKRGEQLRALAKQAQDEGLRVWIWVHELEYDVPARYCEDDAINIDLPGFWDWLQNKYDKFCRDFPEFNGIILTFHETEYKIFNDDQVISELSMPERFAKMINTIDAALARHDKDFVVRSFLYEPRQMEWFAEGIKNVSQRIILQSKCVPHDWQPFYPHNPMIGKFPDRPLIVEFDCSSEFTGRNNIPWTCPHYFEYRWRYDQQQPGVVGYNARLDHAGYDALYTPNEINIYALYRLVEDPDVTADQIWDEWTVKHYGAAAAPWIKKALKPSFEIVNLSYFILGFWITDHSELPSYGYAKSHISSRSIAKWKPDEPGYQELERHLNHPDPDLLERILAEKDMALAMADEAVHHLNQARPYLSGEQYDDLFRRLNLLRRVAYIWKLYAEAFFGHLVQMAGHEVPGLRNRIERALEAMEHQARVSKAIGWTNDPPACSEKLRLVLEDLRIRISMPLQINSILKQRFGQYEIDDVALGEENGQTVYDLKIEGEDDDYEVKFSRQGELLSVHDLL
jgi:hypothetical protein